MHLKSPAFTNIMQWFLNFMHTAVERAASIAKQADVIAALTLEVLKGTTSAFDSGKICFLQDKSWGHYHIKQLGVRPWFFIVRGIRWSQRGSLGEKWDYTQKGVIWWQNSQNFELLLLLLLLFFFFFVNRYGWNCGKKYGVFGLQICNC